MRLTKARAPLPHLHHEHASERNRDSRIALALSVEGIRVVKCIRGGKESSAEVSPRPHVLINICGLGYLRAKSWRVNDGEKSTG